MKTFTLTHGFSLRTSKKASSSLVEAPRPDTVALLPGWIPYVKPRLLVKEGDAVKLGTPIFEDKRNPFVVFPSPGGGVVERIRFGPRRRIDEVVIRLDEIEPCETFASIPPSKIAETEADTFRHLLIKGGAWPLLRSLPFRDHPSVEENPYHIIVTLGLAGGHQARADIALAGEEEAFLNGLAILSRFSPRVHVIAPKKIGALSQKIESCLTARIRGSYPAGDPGHYLYRIRKSPEENRSWYIEAQDLVALARFVTSGCHHTKRVYAVGGNAALKCRHVVSRLGAPVSLLGDGQAEGARHIGGTPFSGGYLPATGYMNLHHKGLTLLPPGDEEDTFGFLRGGYDRPSLSRTFFSVFNKRPLDLDCGFHGEERPCINCSRCATVCPVEILPQFIMKCMGAGEVEEALAHGLLDCIECGLCSYVCPSKIELLETLTQSKAQYRKERDG